MDRPVTMWGASLALALAAGCGEASFELITPEEVAVRTEPIAFEADVIPVLGQCTGCHGTATPQNELYLGDGTDLDPALAAREIWRRLLEEGGREQRNTERRDVVPGDPDESLVLEYTLEGESPSHATFKPFGSRQDRDYDLLASWIVEGACFVPGDCPAADGTVPPQ